MKNLYQLILPLFMFGFLELFAQEELQITQFNDNMLQFNPAYAGSKNSLNSLVLHRQKWTGFNGAPMTDIFSLHSLTRYSNVGVGLSFVNDKIGPLNRSVLCLNFSYALRFENSSLTFGLSGALSMMSTHFNDFYLFDENDPVFINDLRNQLNLDVGLGIFYRRRHFYIGGSLPGVMESKKTGYSVFFNDERHYYFSIGGYFGINRNFKVRPSTLFKFTLNYTLKLDGALAFILYDRLWLGVNYRLAETTGILVQIQLNDKFKLGYSGDFSTGYLAKYAYGTHELLLSYQHHFKHQNALTTKHYYF